MKRSRGYVQLCGPSDATPLCVVVAARVTRAPHGLGQVASLVLTAQHVVESSSAFGVHPTPPRAKQAQCSRVRQR
eukprot:scaffold1817_cov250-Pinguiococcus_pyrenoidosus.AAC.7